MKFPRKTVLVLVAIALIVAASLAVLRTDPQRDHGRSDTTTRPAATTTARSTDEDTRRVARARWEDRRTRIRAAHAQRTHDDASHPRSTSSRDCAEGECSLDAAEHPDDSLFSTFIDETTKLTQGCEELLEGKPAPVRITARLLAAPEVGTIVESVDVSGSGEHVDALTECLTEGMYTLELGDASTNHQRDAVLTLGLLDEVVGEGWLPPERVAEVRQQMIDGGLDPAKDPMTAIHMDEPSSR